MNSTLIRRLSLSLLLAAGTGSAWAASSTAAAPTLGASQCWVRLMPGKLPSAGYLTVHNAGAKAVVVDQVSADGFGMAMMHETQSMGTASRMVMLDSVSVAPGQSVSFAPGGKHLMLEQAQAGLKAGGHIALRLHTTDGDTLSVPCELKSPATTR